MRWLLLWLLALAITIALVCVVGVVAAVLHEVVSGPNDFTSPFFGGFVAATVAWPFNGWLERRFGLNTTQTQGEAE